MVNRHFYFISKRMTITDCFRIGSILKTKGLKGELHIYTDFEGIEEIKFNTNLNFYNKFDELKNKYKDNNNIDDIIELLKKMLQIDSSKRINSKMYL